MTKNLLPDRESNPGLPRDRRGYSPLYYRGLSFTIREKNDIVTPLDDNEIFAELTEISSETRRSFVKLLLSKIGLAEARPEKNP